MPRIELKKTKIYFKSVLIMWFSIEEYSRIKTVEFLKLKLSINL